MSDLIAGSAVGGARASLVVVSFDIDGTLEIGDPPGIVPVELVRRAKAAGFLVGTCSDRPLSFQQALWERLGITPDFTVLKHRLADVRDQWTAARYYHIGDTDLDAMVALGAGFHFLHAAASVYAAWAEQLFA